MAQIPVYVTPNGVKPTGDDQAWKREKDEQVSQLIEEIRSLRSELLQLRGQS